MSDSILIVVDYQCDFVSGALGFPGAELLDEAISAKIGAYRAAGADVAFTMDTHGAGYLNTQEGRKLPVPHCLKGTPGWELYGKTGAAKLERDPCFYKPVFGSLELALWLQKSAYRRIELVGLVSNICVISNAVLVKAALPEAEVLVDAACTASHDPELHRQTLAVLEGLQIGIC